MKQTSEHDLHLGQWLGGAALGALAMYMMDPDRGSPRRALSGAKLRDLGRQGGDLLEKVVQGVSERVGGDAGDRTSSLSSLWRAAPGNSAMLGGGTLGLTSMLMRRMPIAMAVGMAGTALLMRSMRHAALSNRGRDTS